MTAKKILFILACSLQFGVSAQNEPIELQSFYDSLSYALGVENASGLLSESRFDALDKEMLIEGFDSNLSTVSPSDCEGTIQKLLGPQGMDFDTTYLKDGSKCIGRFVSSQFYYQMEEIEVISLLNLDLLKKGFSQTIYKQDAGTMTALERTLVITSFRKGIERKFLAQIEERDNAFWAKVLQTPGVKEVDDTGIYFEVIERGNGGKPTQESDIEAHYILTNTTGDTLESSYTRGLSLKINLQSVIAGWREGFPALEKGGKYRLFVPYEKAYKNGRAEAPQGALCFFIEFIDFGDKGTIASPPPTIKRRKH